MRTIDNAAPVRVALKRPMITSDFDSSDTRSFSKDDSSLWLAKGLADLELPDSTRDQTLKTLQKRIKNIPFVILTATDNDKMLIQSIEAGAQDYLSKEHILDGPLLSRAIYHAIQLWEMKIKKEKIEEENKQYTKKIEEDLKEKKFLLEKARYIQKTLIQKSVPLLEEVNTRALYVPCDILGGDFIRIMKGIYENKLAFIIGDCTDHGLKSSLDASLLLSVIEKNLSQLFQDNRTDLFLNTISNEFSKMADDDQYPTVLVMIIDLNTNELYYSSANSEIPYLFRNSKISKIKKVEGIHLGYLENPLYKREYMVLQPGDKLLLYSDALLEVGTGNSKKRSEDVLERTLQKWNEDKEQNFDSLVKLIKSEYGSFPYDDDLTLLLLEHIEKSEKTYRLATLEDWYDIHQKIPGILKRFDYNIQEIEKISIALNEMFQNALFHGNKGDALKGISFQMTIDCRQSFFIFEDEGDGFDPDSIADPVMNLRRLMDEDKEESYMHGRGIWITKKYMDTVQYNEKGNRVEFIKNKEDRQIRVN